MSEEPMPEGTSGKGSTLEIPGLRQSGLPILSRERWPCPLDQSSSESGRTIDIGLGVFQEVRLRECGLVAVRHGFIYTASRLWVSVSACFRYCSFVLSFSKDAQYSQVHVAASSSMDNSGIPETQLGSRSSNLLPLGSKK